MPRRSTWRDRHQAAGELHAGAPRRSSASWRARDRRRGVLRVDLGDGQHTQRAAGRGADRDDVFHAGRSTVTEVVEIGKRIEQFKRSVERDAARLHKHWKQWEDLQNDFIELGVEVFGAEPFGVDMETEKPRESGFRMEMDGLDREHNAGVEELTREVE